MTKKPIHYLSSGEVAKRLGIRPDTLAKYKLPAPDATFGVRFKGWLPQTIDDWDLNRPAPRIPRPDGKR